MVDAPGQRVHQRPRSVVLQQRETVLDVVAPLRGASMDQFGEPRLRGGAELPQTLALEVQPCPAAADRVEHGRAMFVQQAGARGGPRMPDALTGLGKDLDVIVVEMQRRRLAD